MVFAAQKLRMVPELKNPTVVIVDDRIDLETQITATFNASDIPNLAKANSKEELINFFKGDMRKILITTIFKFGEVSGQLNPRDNIILMVDEAHRTQEGNLGEKMRLALPNAFFFGLTGTPINRVDRNTFATFGAEEDRSGYMSKYSFSDSIRDKATLPLNFEPVPVDLHVDQESLDKAFDALTEGLSEQQKAELSSRVNMQAIFYNPSRIRKICEHIVKHYKEKIEPNGYKAQIVCYDRETCIRYKEELDKLIPEEESTVVIDTNNDKEDRFKKYRRDRDEEGKVLDQFRDPKHPLKFVIVTSKLLTGFDTYQFTNSEIISLQKVVDVDPLSRRLPKETLSFSVFDFEGNYNPSNPSGKWNALDENALLEVQFGYELNGGLIEWLEADQYYLSGRPTVSGGIASFQASSRLNHMTNTYYKGTYGTKSLYELAVNVLNDAGVSSYLIDESLQAMFTHAPLPITTHANCLQLIAHAARSTLRTISNGVIEIKPFSVTNSPDEFLLPLNSIALNGDTISKIETLYKVQCNLYIYLVAETETTLFETNIDVDGETNVHIEYETSTDQVITSSGGELSNIATYAASADFTITGTGTFTITVIGKKISTRTSTSESYISADSNGATDSEKNQLITDASMQSALIYQVANYLQYRLTHTVRYRGNPEIDALDGIYMENLYDAYISALVLTHTINFNGAISGTLVLKSLSEITNVYLYDSSSILVEDELGDAISIIGTADYTSVYSVADINSFIEEVIE